METPVPRVEAIRAGRSFDVAVVVCTYRRNEPLRRALFAADRALVELAQTKGSSGCLVIVDDNPDGSAKSVATEVQETTGRHVEYRHSGLQNISIARNTALDTGFGLAHFVAMIDDDGQVWDDWLVELMKTSEKTSADIVTGPYTHQAPETAPKWLLDSPFLGGSERYIDGAQPSHGCTANALFRSTFFDAQPVRFRQDLGVIGGEDMVFFADAVAAGAVHRYALNANVWEILPLERTTFRHQFYALTWMGNTEAVTNLESRTATRARLVMRAGRRSLKETIFFVKRLGGGSPASSARYWIAQQGKAAGMVLGAFGVRLGHR